ncbi:MAG: 4-hydroxybenzoate 3-monooxygenase [Pseudomonadota bacterium]|nr:4-hydroxybenzoate 3-monooxygenase [Pseudomonadota bacterium]
MRTQVGIIGSGPAGLLLSQLLDLQGIESVVLERRSQAYVLSRVRAGVLEEGTVAMLRQAQAGERMDREGLIHEGLDIAIGDHRHRIDLKKYTGKTLMFYGQTELTKDLMDARKAMNAQIVYEAKNVSIEDLDSKTPKLHYEKNDKKCEVVCDFIAGCDGFHGISRRSIPETVLKTHEQVYPFGWLGVLSETRPVSDEVIYINNWHGFALCSMRSMTRSRYYIQCASDEDLEKWTDDRFWDALRTRLPQDAAESLEIGPSIEKSIAPLRSFVAEPIQYGRLFLAGDAAHIVPPTGAKGLNLAASDVHYLSNALVAFYMDKDMGLLESYSHKCLKRVWQAERFSWWLTSILHRFPDQSSFNRSIQVAELDYLMESDIAQAAFAENYVGLPF